MPDSFILFFCSFDYLNSGLPVYTFKTICSEDKKIILPDGVTKVIINSASADKESDLELKAFLEYMNGITSDRPFIRKIDRYIRDLKENEERRREYMLMQAFEMDARRDGIQQGLQQGLHQKAIQDACNLKRLGVSIDIIAQATGLSKEEVENA